MPYNGIAYLQGASDYRMVHRYDHGKPTLLASYTIFTVMLVKWYYVLQWRAFKDGSFVEQDAPSNGG